MVISPDGHGILIDAGPAGCGLNPVKEFMDRTKQDGRLTSLDYVVSTHYDEDHIGGMDEVLDENGWYPTEAVYDRGDSFLPPFDEDSSRTSATSKWRRPKPSPTGAASTTPSCRRTRGPAALSSSTGSRPSRAASERRSPGTCSPSATRASSSSPSW